MSAKDKNGLGYDTQLDEMSNKSENDSKINMSVFEVRSSDEEITPVNDRFYKSDGYHDVPLPIIGNFLTPRVDISFAGLDGYAIRKKIIESKTTKLNTDTSKSKTSETIDDEDDVSAVKIVNPVKTNETQTVRNRVDKIGQISQKEEIGFKKIKACFVCKSTDHLIKDYDFYDIKSLEPKLKIVVNTGQRVIKPVWDYAKRVNKQKFSNNLKYPQARRTFIPSGVLTRTSLVNPVRPNGKRAVHTVSTARPVSTARQFSPKIAQTGSAIRPIYPRMDNVRLRASYSPIKRSYYTRPVTRPKDLKQDVKNFEVKNMTTARTRAVVNTGKGKMDNALKKSRWGNPEIILQDHAVVDSGCSSHMTRNKTYLSDYKDYNGGVVAFGSDPKGDELKFNLFSVSQICDKKNNVLFTDTECLILSPSFKLLDESQVVLRAPRQNGVYSLDLKSIVPSGGITCLYENATTDESKLWHRRLGHVNFKNINKLVKGHLVRGLPSKVFVNDHTCVACKKGKQHKASCKAKLERTIRKPLELLHMDLFGPVSVESINKKKYCLVVTDDFSRFSWILVDLPFGKKAISTKWVFKNKRDERSIVVKNKARLVAQGFRYEEGINYDEVFAPVARIEAIRLFLAFASFMGFPVYQMDVKSAFLYGTIEEEVYVHQPPGFVDPAHPNKVYKVIKALYGLHQAPRAWYETLYSFLLENGFRRVKQQPDGIFISQDKYVADILKMFDFCSIKTSTTPIASNKPLVKDEDGVDVDVHVYRSMIGSLMYLTALRLDIMFAVCACARFQVTPKASHLNAVKRIFRLRARYGAELVSDASLVNTARPTLSTARLGRVGAARHKSLCFLLPLLLLFWNIASSQTVNDEKQIHATVDSKAVVVIEASIRSSLLLNDADGTACLTNEAIFQNLALMGYEGELNKLTFQKAIFSPQWKYLIHTILHCQSLKSTSWNEFSTNIASTVICLVTNQKFNFSKLIFDGMLRNLDTSKKKFLMYPRFLMVFLNNQIEIGEPFNNVYVTPAHTQKVFSNKSREGVKFLGKVTPLFDCMLVPHQAPEGEGSDQHTEPQLTPSPTYPSTRDQPPVTTSSPSNHTSEKSKGGLNLKELFVLCTNLSNRVLTLETSKDAQAIEILKLKDQIKKLKRKCKPSISHHRAWLKSVKRLLMKKRLGRKEYVSKQGRKNAKPKLTLDAFNDLDAGGRDYMETEDVVKEGKQSSKTDELNTGSGDKGGSTEELISTDVPKTVSTTRPELSTVRPNVDAARQEDSMKEEKAKEKGVSIKDIKDSLRHARSILTLKLLPTIDPKDKGKSVLKEPEPAKKMTRSDFDAAQIARDVEIARQLDVDLQAEVERERQREEEASKAVIAELYDEVQAGIDAGALFAAKLQ
ncbi:putative ribonuclease H-like domain-containing protein [Tanacetum coccineum]